MVNTKMTTIAEKIRSLLGITGKMGLDAMATNLETEQANIDAAYAAISTKGGTVPSSKVSGNLASAIASISLGVDVQRNSGSFSTSRGQATVNCGFKPDVVFVKGTSFSEDNILYNPSQSIVFSEDDRNIPLTTMHTSSGTLDLFWEQKSNGFSVNIYAYDLDWKEVSPPSSLNYVAIKYT